MAEPRIYLADKETLDAAHANTNAILAALEASGGEHKKAVQALNGLRDTYIENGRYTDGIDTVLMRIMNARYRTYRTR